MHKIAKSDYYLRHVMSCPSVRLKKLDPIGRTLMKIGI